MSYYAISHSPVFSGAYYKFSSPYLKKLPIRRINFEDRQDKAKHDRIVVLGALMLDLHKKLRKATTPSATTTVQRQIESTGLEINQLVYRLYELSADDIEA